MNKPNPSNPIAILMATVGVVILAMIGSLVPVPAKASTLDGLYGADQSQMIAKRGSRRSSKSFSSSRKKSKRVVNKTTIVQNNYSSPAQSGGGLGSTIMTGLALGVGMSAADHAVDTVVDSFKGEPKEATIEQPTN